jgi:rRNA-processing protein EBP2
MSPKTKKIKTDHVESSETDQIEEKEPEWYLLEDLEAEDIDDEYGDMVIEQRLLVNNKVKFNFCKFIFFNYSH